MPEELVTVLSGLSDLVGSRYGELSLKAKQIIDDSKVKPTTAIGTRQLMTICLLVD